MKRFDWVNDLNPEAAFAIVHYGIWLKCNNASDGNKLYDAISYIGSTDARVIGEGIMRPLSFGDFFEESLRDLIDDYEYQ